MPGGAGGGGGGGGGGSETFGIFCIQNIIGIFFQQVITSSFDQVVPL